MFTHIILMISSFKIIGILIRVSNNAKWHCFPQVIACLDVRTNDKGDLVVTKGDQYDVREDTVENEVRKILLLKYSIKKKNLWFSL